MFHKLQPRLLTNRLSSAQHYSYKLFGVSRKSHIGVTRHAAGARSLRTGLPSCPPQPLLPRSTLLRQNMLLPTPSPRGLLTITAAATSKTDSQDSQEREGSSMALALGGVGLVMGLGVANRVLYKMALMPLHDYVFFLAQFQTVMYTVVYFGILFWRMREGKVDKQMIDATPKQTFLYIGLAEALSQVLGFVGASKLPGVVLPLLSQTILLWQVGVSRIVLGKKLTPTQIAGALLVVAGVGAAAWPANSGTSILSEVQPMYTAIYILSMFFPAISSILKEKIFEEGKQKLGGRQLDLFVVNSFGSAAQALFVLLLLPVLSSLRGIPLSELPSYLLEGWSCLTGSLPGCESAPLLASAYVACNLAFNIAILNLLRTSGNIVVSLTLSAIVPLTIWAFTLDLPYIDAAPQLGANFWAGSGVLIAGLLVFNSPKWLPALKQKFQ